MMKSVNDYNFNDYNVLALQNKKTLRETYKEVQANLEMTMRGNSTLLDSYKKDTQFYRDAKFFKDDSSGLYPIDAFQVLDLTLNLPLNKFWAQELLPMRLGGGAVESFAFFRTNVGVASGRLAGGNTNEVPLVAIGDEKITVPIYPIRLGMLIGDVDLMKSEQVNYGILERQESAVRTSYWREIELFAFQGNVNIGDITTSTSNFYPGLFNIATSGAGITYKAEATTAWASLTTSGWTTNLLAIIKSMKKAVRYNRDYYPNTVLIPPTAWDYLQAPAVIGSGTEQAGLAVSILDYVTKQIKLRLGVEVEFIEMPYLDPNAQSTDGFWVEASGANSTGRMVFYRKDEKVIKLPIAMPLTGGATLPSPTEGGIRKNFLAFAGPLAIVYPETISYYDNKGA